MEDISKQIMYAGGNYSQLEIMTNIERDNKEKIEEFKNRIKEFATVSTLEEAKELAAKILPVSQEINRFNIGNAKCTIVNRDNLFRISFDSDLEFIAYDFQ